MDHKTRRKHIVLAFPVSMPWLALVFRGVTDYAREHGGWDFTTSPAVLSGTGESALTVCALKGFPADGVIATIKDLAEARAARRLGIPVVNIGSNLGKPGLPRVMSDQYTIGRLAAGHLLSCGLQRLAYHGLVGLWYSQERERGFVDQAAEAGVPCEVSNISPCTNPRALWRQQSGPLVEWLRTLRPPVGVLAVHDYRARTVIDECLRLGLHVPHDVAILGIDNDLIACEFSQPTLSSVSRNTWKIGYEAATLLGRLMAGQASPQGDILIPPDDIISRQSTDTLAVDDPHVRIAIRFMIDHLGETFGIEQVMKQISISRRRLEKQFQRLVQCSPHEYLCRLRVERVKQLLAEEGPIKMQTIAIASGFSSPSRMRLVFRRIVGMTPQEYRRTLTHRGSVKR